MKLKQNEQGIALITVLLIITIFTILGMSAMSFTLQSNQLRTYADDEVESKMLAEMGLLYFQEYLKEKLDVNQLETFPSTYPDQITDIIKDLAYEKPASGERFKATQLPDGQGAFAIMYRDKKTIPYKGDSADYTQPYSKTIEVSVIGIPKSAIGDYGKRVIRTRLNATLYINTIPSPFHYAMSTPNELRLFGGSNIIGNIEVGNRMLVSTSYKYNEYLFAKSKDKWTLGTDLNIDKNQPYIEGKVFLKSSAAKLYSISSFTQISEENPPEPVLGDPYPLDRQNLKDILSPKGDFNETGIISTEPESPDKPGSEPPFFQKTSTEVMPIPFGEELTLKEYIKSQFDKSRSSNNITIDKDDLPLAFEVGDDWSTLEGSSEKEFFIPHVSSFGQASKTANIYSKQGNIYVTEDAPYQLTARLTTDWLQLNGFTQLYIGPDPADSTDSTKWNGDEHATVEMGSTHSFDDPPDNTKEGGEFTFTGPIFIKGNLDIVGNIKVKGTIFVDGDVVIRDIANLNVDYPMVIMATGKVTVSNRASNVPLNTFIYSDEKSIEIYSIDSINRINGGIATGEDLIELNTLRKTNVTDLNSRLTIKFDRGIFEKEMPGLPSSDHFFIDTYDMVYLNYQGDIE